MDRGRVGDEEVYDIVMRTEIPGIYALIEAAVFFWKGAGRFMASGVFVKRKSLKNGSI